MLTLSQIRPLLFSYGSNVPYASATSDDKAAFDAKLNQVLERLGAYRQTMAAVITVYTDKYGNPIITVPREFNKIISAAGCYPLTIHGNWFDYLPNWSFPYGCNGVVSLPGKFTSYQDWTAPLQLRIKLDKPETVRFLIRGKLYGEKIYTDESGNWIEGLAVNYVGATVTTSQLFDEPPYAFVKPVTKGIVRLFTVDTGGVETQVGVYQPGETSISFFRYRVPQSMATPVPLTTSSSSDLPANVYSKTDVNAMFGYGNNIAVNSAAGSPHDLAPNKPFVQWFQRIIAQAGSGSYTHKFTLDSALALPGAIFRIGVDIAQSANPHIEIYDNSVSGTLLDNAAVGDVSSAAFYYAEFGFDGSNWRKISGAFLV